MDNKFSVRSWTGDINDRPIEVLFDSCQEADTYAAQVKKSGIKFCTVISAQFGLVGDFSNKE